MAIRYWLLVHAAERARELVAAGAVQGGPVPLREFREADGVVLYAPREGGEPLRAVVACGRVAGAAVERGGRGMPWWEVPVQWQDAQPALIRPLRGALDLTRDRERWGEQLRPGWVELSPRDWVTLRDAMRVRTASE